MIPRIELICFGTELLKDKTNTNIHLISKQLSAAGLSIARAVTVGDDLKEIESSLKESLGRSDCVITCGGLGPTFDDLTREAVSKILKRPLIYAPKIAHQIENRFKMLKRKMPKENQKQAELIAGACPILNSTGTAPGQMIEDKKKILILLPGPPGELAPMMEQTVCPYLKKKYSKRSSRSLHLRIFGMPESEVDELIQPVIQRKWSSDSLKVDFGILAHQYMVEIEIMIEGGESGMIDLTMKRIKKEFLKIFGENIFGKNEETLESVAGQWLKKRKETLSVAESCTGGLLSGKVTDQPGSSAYFKGGIIAYSNEIKINELGVRRETLNRYGAVSEETAKEMAVGMKKKSGSDWALSITGIAGPAGGTKQKPVGTVCFGLAGQNFISARTHWFLGSRKDVREKSVLTALDILRRQLSARK